MAGSVFSGDSHDMRDRGPSAPAPASRSQPRETLPPWSCLPRRLMLHLLPPARSGKSREPRQGHIAAVWIAGNAWQCDAPTQESAVQRMSKNRKHAYSGRGLDMKVKSNLFMPTGWQRRTSKNHEPACDIRKSAREIIQIRPCSEPAHVWRLRAFS